MPRLAAAALLFAAGLAAQDGVAIARRFADFMIEHGRDRYGRVSSPLFSSALTRGPQPGLTPYPLFAPGRPERREHLRVEKRPRLRERYPGVTFTRFLEFDFNRCLNYPSGLEKAGPHKVTVYGSDPFEDRDLYLLLFDLTRVTGDGKYRREAERALEWWFANTQSPVTGLYPWGEHMGWDFAHDAPTYFEGPSKNLYHSAFHEVKDRLPFLDILARLPAPEAGSLTPLERYAEGIWERHFWDKERAIYCRHGDYTGEDNRLGSALGFPAHLTAYMDVWTQALRHTRNPAFRARMTAAFHKTLDMAVARSDKFGFFPFTFAPELEDGEAVDDGQRRRLGASSRELAREIRGVDASLADKLDRLAARNDPDQRGAPREPSENLAAEKMADPWAAEIMRLVAANRVRGARQTADKARDLFLDDVSPLPRALAKGVSLETPTGQPFPDFYFRGARLIRALLEAMPAAK